MIINLMSFLGSGGHRRVHLGFGYGHLGWKGLGDG